MVLRRTRLVSPRGIHGAPLNRGFRERNSLESEHFSPRGGMLDSPNQTYRHFRNWRAVGEMIVTLERR
jgi:hypothetical protein